MSIRSTAIIYYVAIMAVAASPTIYRADLAGEQRQNFRANKKRQWKKRRRAGR